MCSFFKYLALFNSPWLTVAHDKIPREIHKFYFDKHSDPDWALFVEDILIDKQDN